MTAPDGIDVLAARCDRQRAQIQAQNVKLAKLRDERNAIIKQRQEARADRDAALDLVARYQACASSLWALFERDPLGDHPAQGWLQRLEAITSLGLLGPRGTP